VQSNGEVEGPPRSAGRWRRGRTISKRPRRQPQGVSRTPPTIVRRRHWWTYPHVTLLQSEAGNHQRNATECGCQINIVSNAPRSTPSQGRKDCERFKGVRQRHDPEAQETESL